MKGFIILLPMVVVFTIVLLVSVSGMDIDQLIADAGGSDSEMSFSFDNGKEVIRLEYDILMSFDEYNELQQRESGQRKKRTVSIKRDLSYPRTWSDGFVFYEILPHFDEREEGLIYLAIREWERYTCLQFHQNNRYSNRIQFKNGQGCMSYIGMVNDPQAIILGPGCRYMSVILHEIGHALGLFHEQTRPDRDEYVSIFQQNVAPDMLYNFKKRSWETVANTGIPYDYMSIMHYGKKAFSRNGQFTIRTADPSYQDKIGKMQALSFRDIKTINQLYRCGGRGGCSLQDSDCPGEGFVSKDCTCLCPGEANDVEGANSVILCEETPRPTTPRPTTPRPTIPTTTPRPDVSCVDDSSSCTSWYNWGYCTGRNQNFVRPKCRLTCGVCSNPEEEEDCRDTHGACQSWHSRGYCNGRNQEIVRSKCKHTCGLCPEGITLRPTPRPTTPRPDGSCRDTRRACKAWGRRGYCNSQMGSFTKRVRSSCPLTCEICG